MGVRLSFPREPYWIDLANGVRVQVRPLTTAAWETARARARRLAEELADHEQAIAEAGGAVDGLPDLTDPDARQGLSQMLYVIALAQGAILAWDGVGDAAGAPAPVTADSVEALIRNVPSIAETFVVAYTRPLSEALAEGNG